MMSIIRANKIAGKIERGFQREIIIPIRTVLTARQSRTKWLNACAGDYLEVQIRTLEFVESMKVSGDGEGVYAYKFGGPPLLYASCYAALILHLCGRLQLLPQTRKQEWAEYIRSFQSADGLFRDRLIACHKAEIGDSWGWRHLTLHASMALAALGQKPKYDFGIITKFREPGCITRWLEERDWVASTAHVSNEVQNIGTLMQYSRYFFGSEKWDSILSEMYDWLDSKQDKQTGLWGLSFSNAKELSMGVQSAYHFWMLYFYDGREIKLEREALHSCMRTQNKLGGFGYVLNTSACEDIDSIDPIARLGCSKLLSETERFRLKGHCLDALPWVLAHQNIDGGWVFRRHAAFNYGCELMSSSPDESVMFPTWFRLLSLAYLSKQIPEHPISKLGWSFMDFPGHQYWLGRTTSSVKQPQ